MLKLQKEKSYVRSSAGEALGSAYPHLLERNLAWVELNMFIQDRENELSKYAINILRSAFPYFPSREQAWADMYRLAEDDDIEVQAIANHSLGKASIFKATEVENEDDCRKEIENALGFFEKSLEETPNSNPSRFCLPFYRSFYAITFNKQETETEVQKYLSEAKSAVEGSESKEKLLEAVENLGNALKEAKRCEVLAI